ncbi:thioredoxin family protein [Comamonas endophytica]|uniref:Thioredoxin family protein n=1 Tax=Comamonas endophytica TaxID=2949090 RepID=A0ABY6G8L2_9BURK|nr:MULTISPECIES: thioredoxin family protein [unclassified Acidovorax]MCD2514090.1 thioredoxin family protein [Acidovorax sp. D4N7]UYG51231.1 thioredoxin family protein [Acidovorax sp. 5MLIR]
MDSGQSVEGRQWLVVCLCAQWCGTCTQYRQGFEALAASHPEARFVWLDIEDREDVAGDLDIETFPSLLISDARHARFLGPLLPQLPVLARLLVSLQEAGLVEAPVSVAAQDLRERVLAAGMA